MCTLMAWVHHRRRGRTDGYSDQHWLGKRRWVFALLHGNFLSYSSVIDNVKNKTHWTNKSNDNNTT